jgi:signal transduction histidine kinase
VPAGLRATVRKGLVASYSGTWNGNPVVWAGRRTPDGSGELYVRDSYAPQRQELADLRRTLIESAAAATLAGALVGLLLAGRLSLRLRRAAATAGRVTAGELDARINAEGSDEVAKLGEAIDGMAEAMQRRIERERQFTADVAHDLRTPLTGLKTASSLLPHDEVSDAVRERVDRLLGLVEDLLEISRLDAGTATADLRRVDLGAFVSSVVADAPDVSVTMDGASVTLIDPRRLERVIENVIENATRHGAPPVEVKVSPGQIALRDHGPGFSEPMLTKAAERFIKGDSARGGGFGLGLAIAAGQCRVLGGELRLANHPDGGAVVTIDLPPA